VNVEGNEMSSPTYWQIACGSYSRDYSNLFIRFGMAFVGGDDYVNTIRKVKEGDRVLLKKGTTELVAVGEIIEREGKCSGQDDKEWLMDFDGWDLPGYCFVDWHVPKQPIKTSGLTRTTIQKVNKEHLKILSEKTLSSVPIQPNIYPEPNGTNEITDHEILEFLIRQGLRTSAAEDLTVTFNRIRLLANYYYQNVEFRDHFREHETRTFLVIPLLLALGWAEQQIKIEMPVENKKQRMKADIVCFSKPFANLKSDCVLVIETKGFSHGLDYAPDQAKSYAVHFENCRVVLVTNGYCYKAYGRNKDGVFSQEPVAYLNLLRPRDQYPIDPGNVAGCLETLRLMLPSYFLNEKR
jgi:hypothetical protein